MLIRTRWVADAKYLWQSADRNESTATAPHKLQGLANYEPVQSTEKVEQKTNDEKKNKKEMGQVKNICVI